MLLFAVAVVVHGYMVFFLIGQHLEISLLCRIGV